MHRVLPRGLRLPALAALTVLFYAVVAAALLVASIWYYPGKNPRWVLGALAATTSVLALVAAFRGVRFTRREATGFLAIYLVGATTLSVTTSVDLGAFSNGLVLPVLGIYAGWLLSRRAAYIFYLGVLAWLIAVSARGDTLITTMAAITAFEAVIVTEIVSWLSARVTRLMYTDPLTGVLNRAGSDRRLATLYERYRRGGKPFSVGLIDLDGLREVNNTRGHQAGDELLQRAASEWRSALRPHESVGRIGGDEFVLIFAESDHDEASERVKALQSSSTAEWSVGVAALRPEDELTSLLERADSRMYDGKRRRAESRISYGPPSASKH